MAYAAMISLLQITKKILNSDQFSDIFYPKSQIQYLHDKAFSLKVFLEERSEFSSESRNHDLEGQIRDAIHKAEDIIESNISEYFISTEEESYNNISIFVQDLQRVTQQIDSLAEKSLQKLDRRESSSRPSVLSRRVLPQESLIVGRDHDLYQLKDRVLGSNSRLEVVPIVGGPGIGKTTLAECIYRDPLIVSHFKARAWVTVSLEYSRREVLIDLLRSMRKLFDETHQRTDQQLAKYLYNYLKSRRYLVVLEDVCDVKAFNDLKELFPDYNNGSRIMLTTRDMDVARFACTIGCRPHNMRYLSECDTWELLCRIVFNDEWCPRELVEIGRRITEVCLGVPLAVVTIAWLLSTKRITDWEKIYHSINHYPRNDELIDSVVSLSYDHLPPYLKACLLYMGIFPQKYEIPVSKLVKLWIAEGFLELIGFETLEEMAEECLWQLVDKNLVSVCQQSSSGGIKSCKILYAFRDFFMRKVQVEKFFHVINKSTNGFLENTYGHRRLFIHKSIRFGIKDVSEYNIVASVSTARSFIYSGPDHEYPLTAWLDFKLLRVLDAHKIRFYKFPLEILKLVQLRYLAFSYNGKIPASICKLQNLQFLIVLQYLSIKICGAPLYLPMEIWNMKELRHLQVMGSDLPNPDGMDNTDLFLENLLTLLDVGAQSCTPGVLKRISNLKKLGIQVELLSVEKSYSFLSHLLVLQRLESLKCIIMQLDLGSQVVSSAPAFPPSLRKLTLSGCGFPWEIMSIIAALPNLEVLKLRSYAFKGPEWEMKEDEFTGLKFLLLEDMDIKHWVGDYTNFPQMTHLIIRHCYKLREIPCGFGEIAKLEMIEVVQCSPTVVISAEEIEEKQRSMGNYGIEVQVHSSLDDEDFDL
ncbi:hypothetical protein BUALT_Bualt07G0017600 [Buddleja alternifolia]|uniref:NB-ARC domain-containing protein n=1 Tax=Buddleja alternifolia TaxID=168488 RepID=A0AAV6XI54_9LAMI|nr:hypothetical protein BUALT_Bualt07G0017600 [Buddleja alternifolia]